MPPEGTDLSKENYWIRTIPADRCSSFELGNKPDERQGILCYDNESTAIPTGERKNVSTTCRNEPADLLRPKLPWTVGEPVNPWKDENDGTFEVGIDKPSGKGPHMYGLFARWGLGKDSLWLKFSDPTALNLGNEEACPKWVIIPEDFNEDDGVTF